MFLIKTRLVFTFQFKNSLFSITFDKGARGKYELKRMRANGINDINIFMYLMFIAS